VEPPATDHRIFLEVREIDKRFGAFTALDNVSISARRGEFVSILGPSGCGKTTMLRVIAGLEAQNNGTVWLNGRDVTREPVTKRNLGIVFQSYALFPNLTILANVGYGLQGRKSLDKQKRSLEMLDLVGLADQAHKFPAQLSGGQQQRVALARALSPCPELLLLDEPLSALDARVRVHLRKEIRRIQEQLGITTIMVTHDQEEALTMADRVVVLNEGRLMQFATPQELYRKPANPFVADFIGSMNFIRGCTTSGKDSVLLDGYTLQVDYGDTGIREGGQITLAIRPEDLKVGNQNRNKANWLKARVQGVEFRGAVDRVTLDLLSQEGVLVGRQLYLDLQDESAEDLALRTGHDLQIILPPRKLLSFPPTVNEDL